MADSRMLPVTAVKFGVCRGLGLTADAQQRAESVERVEAPVKPERELVQVGLKMLLADAVVTAAQPAFEVAEHEVHNRQVFLGNLRINALPDLVAELTRLRSALSDVWMQGDATRNIPVDSEAGSYLSSAIDEMTQIAREAIPDIVAAVATDSANG